ncbi:MAG TPA: DUF1573 domain-containing protein [Balneolales bacterium]|nr:DUF1573 domain-containing protein [Balneolales bacterium]
MTGLHLKLRSHLLLILIILITGPYKLAYKKGNVVFKKTSHNFGVIKEGDVVTYSFKFKNVGQKRIQVISADASCICTTFSLPKKKIKPGETGLIKVQFNSNKLPGRFKKRLIVSFDTKPFTVPLYIKGMVLPKPLTGKDVSRIGGLSFSEGTVHLGDVSKGQKVNKIITIQNASTYPIKVDSVIKPENIHITYPKFKILAGERLKMSFSFKPDSQKVNREFRESITFVTNDSLKRRKVVYLTGYLLPANKKKNMGPVIKYTNSLKNIGNVIQNDTLRVSYHFKNVGDRPLTIQKIIPSCGCTTANIKKRTFQPSEQGTIHVIINTVGKIGFIEKEVRVSTNANNEPEHKLILEFNVIQHPSSQKMMQKAASDKILIFQGKCRSCHVKPGIGKKGAALYAASCQMCHGDLNRKRGKYYPGIRFSTNYLESISRTELFNLIARGTPDKRKRQMMPGFLKKFKGPYSKTQIYSLVKYLKSIQSTH